jgi:hypothetical protein
MALRLASLGPPRGGLRIAPGCRSGAIVLLGAPGKPVFGLLGRNALLWPENVVCALGCLCCMAIGCHPGYALGGLPRDRRRLGPAPFGPSGRQPERIAEWTSFFGLTRTHSKTLGWTLNHWPGFVSDQSGNLQHSRMTRLLQWSRGEAGLGCIQQVAGTPGVCRY